MIHDIYWILGILFDCLTVTQVRSFLYVTGQWRGESEAAAEAA